MSPHDEAAATARLGPVLGALFRAAVVAAAALLLVGLTLSFVHHPSYLHSVRDLAALERPGQSISRVSEVVAGLAGGHGSAVVLVALGLLVATPALGLVVAIVRFGRARARGMAVVCAVLLAMLVFSVALGRG